MSAVGQLEIENLALQMLGAQPLISLNDVSNSCRQANLAFLPTVNAELRAHRWKFSIVRVNLPQLNETPANGIYTNVFQIPADNLRILNVGDWDPGTDMSDYRYRTVAEYSIENDTILTNYAAPLSLRYITSALNPGQFDPCFVLVVAARIAWRICEAVTQSETKRQLAMKEYDAALKDAARANALEGAPEFTDDSSWMVARIN